MSDVAEARQRLFHETLMARKRIYAVGAPTPLQAMDLDVPGAVYLKREDLSPIHSYKWRGAFNRMAVLDAADRERGVVCASAGNHAQGVALAARHLGVRARVYMPTSTPRMKQQAVARHGGEWVEVVLTGDAFDRAAAEALDFAAESGRAVIHPYDDYHTMGGQGALADEIVMSGQGPFDAAYLQIGGGGMAASVACWLKAYYPDIHIVGVEGRDQASMRAAVEAGGPVALDYVDVFCDGTAVKQAGALTYPRCADLIDEFVDVTNEEVCAAIESLWESRRCISEPSGAMGLAGLIKHRDTPRGEKALVVLCGANVDFDQLAWIAHHAGIGAERRRYYRLQMEENAGGLLHLLEEVIGRVNIVELQYGKVSRHTAWPVIGFEASPPELALLERALEDAKIPHEDVTSQADIEFRIVNYEPDLFHLPRFIIYEFPERAGALLDFLRSIRASANVCYFNYTATGEQVGRALIGFEFKDESHRDLFDQTLREAPHRYRTLDEHVTRRILGGVHDAARGALGG